MTINMTFTFANAGEAADFLAQLNGLPASNPAANAVPDEVPPWEDEPASAQNDSKPAADPWADDAKPASPASAQTSTQHDAAGVLWPPDTKPRAKDSPTGSRTWTFNLPDAPACDCGYPAAKVEGLKGKRTWSAWWCPLGFGSHWKDKCKFSEFV